MMIIEKKIIEKLKEEFLSSLNEKTSFKINQNFRILTRDKKREKKILTTKGRNFLIDNFYEGIAKI